VAGWLLAISSGLLLAVGILGVGYLAYVPKRIPPAQWAACAAVFALLLVWFRLGEAVMCRCGIKIYRESAQSAGGRDSGD
jgi:hypothetical protein